MKKSAIKVIKRKDVAEKRRVGVKDIKPPANSNQKIVKEINDWVFEHEKTRDREKVFSDNKILSWKLLPKTFEKVIPKAA